MTLINTRIKQIQIAEKIFSVLNENLDDLWKVSRMVVGNLNHFEQMLLIAILSKLDKFHDSIYLINIESADSLDIGYKRLN